MPLPLGRDALAVPPPPARHPQPLSHCDEKMRGEGSKSRGSAKSSPRPFSGQGTKTARLAEVPSVSGAREQERAEPPARRTAFDPALVGKFVVLKSRSSA